MLKKNKISFFAFVLTLLLVVLPNVYWNFNNGWVTLTHTSDNANLENLNLNIYEPIKFLIAQMLMVSPVLSLCFIFFFKYFRIDFENRFLLLFSMPILFIVLLESFLVRANANWAAPALISIFIIFFKFFNKKRNYILKINFFLNYFIAVFLFFSILGSFENKVFNRVKGIERFSEDILEVIKERDLIVSDRIVFSNLSYEMRHKKNNILMPFNSSTPITNHFQMSAPLGSDRRSGFFLLGDLNDVSYLSNKHTGELIKQFDVPFSSQRLFLYEVDFK